MRDRLTLISAFLLWLLLSPAHAQIGNFGNAASPQAALTNTAVSVKASPGILSAAYCYNPNAAVEYVQVYDLTTTVTVGTTPAKFFVPLTPSTITNVLINANMINGIQVAGTTTSGGGSAPGSPLVCTFLFK